MGLLLSNVSKIKSLTGISFVSPCLWENVRSPAVFLQSQTLSCSVPGWQVAMLWCPTDQRNLWLPGGKLDIFFLPSTTSSRLQFAYPMWKSLEETITYFLAKNNDLLVSLDCFASLQEWHTILFSKTLLQTRCWIKKQT